MSLTPAYIFYPKDIVEKRQAIKILSEIVSVYEHVALITEDFTSVAFYLDTLALLSHPIEVIREKNKAYHLIELTFEEFKRHCLIYTMTIGKSI